MRSQTNSEGILCYEFESLQEFLHWQIDYYIDSPIHGMLYRGLSDEAYELIPTAHRWDSKCRQLSILKSNPVYSELNGWSLPSGNERQVAKAELAGLKTFFEVANRQGCNLPHSFDISNLLFRKYNNKYMEAISEWYTADIVELAALAQHSGFPTRLLDWTYDFNTALYFAVHGIISKLHNGKEYGPHYIIWCMDAESLGLYNDHCKNEVPVEFFVPNYADNPNLRAQSGVLAYHHIYDMDAEFSVKPLDKIILDCYKESGLPAENPLVKILIPTDNAVSDFKYLQSIGYHAAKLFPGYDGVMRKIQEDEWIRDLEKKARGD